MSGEGGEHATRHAQLPNAPATEDGKDRLDKRWIDAKKNEDENGYKTRARLEDTALFLELLLVPLTSLPRLELCGVAPVADAHFLDRGAARGS